MKPAPTSRSRGGEDAPYTPILTFPRQGGREKSRPVILRAAKNLAGIKMDFCLRRNDERVCFPCEDVRGRVLNPSLRMMRVAPDTAPPLHPHPNLPPSRGKGKTPPLAPPWVPAFAGMTKDVVVCHSEGSEESRSEKMDTRLRGNGGLVVRRRG